MASFINAIIASQKTHERLGKKLGGMEIELFMQAATISNVADPEELSRVKVLYGENANAESDWMPVLNQGKGRISSQFLETKAIVATISGNSDNPIVLGIFGDTPDGLGVNGPVTVPVIDKADLANATDPGSICSEKNEGRIYIFTNNVSQDAKICVRRNNRQNDPNADVWEWKNISRGLVVEKSDDPKQVDRDLVKAEKKPLPKCSQELESEQITFTEDRDFRQAQLVCKKDENEDWAWTPVAAVPTYFKTTLPKCTEKIHGQTALIDDGNNSEMGVCVRFDQDMKWVKYGSRQVVKFANKPEPISKSEMINSAKPNPKLEEEAPQFSSASFNPFGESNVLNEIFSVAGGLSAGTLPFESPFGTGDSGFDSAQQVGQKILESQGSSITELIGALSSENVSDFSNLFDKLGPEVGKVLKEGELDPATILAIAGSSGLTSGLTSINAQDAGVFSSLLTGGGQGALDAAVQYGLDEVSGPAGNIFKEIVGELDLGSAPAILSSILDSGANGGLSSAVSNITQGLNIAPSDIVGLVSQLGGGQFGPVAQIFQNFSNFSSLESIIPGLPTTGSSLLGLAGLGSPLSLAFPGAGLGVSAATSLLGGGNPLSSILGGGGAFGPLGGVFGGGGDTCPCNPKCRKTKHGIDSDGNRLLDPAGTLTVDNNNVYGPDILNNNNTCLAEEKNLFFTGIGKDLIPSNLLDFTSAISSIPRVDKMSDEYERAVKGGAEVDDLNLELIYTLEGIEKTFKMADNNISLMELIQNLNLLGDADFMDNLITGPRGGLMGKMSTDDIEMSEAIEDLYDYVRRLDRVKDGGSAGVRRTRALSQVFKHKSEIPKYFNKSRARALINLIKNILEALSVLGTLDPVLAAPFDSLSTRNNESKVLNDSLAGKLALNQPTEDTLNSSTRDFSKLVNGIGTDGLKTQINFLTPNQLDSGEFDTLLDQIKNEQERAVRREGDCS